MTLLTAAAAGALLWTASQFNLHRTGGYWAAMGVVAAGGLLLGLTQIRGSDGNPRGMFLLAFLPVLVVGLWLIITAEPLSNTFRSHLRTWNSHMGIAGAVNDIALWNGVIALGVGLVFGLLFEPGMAFRRQHAGDMREGQAPEGTTPAEPIAAAAEDKPVERKPAPAPSRFRRSLHH
jgi:hypothetical protein